MKGRDNMTTNTIAEFKTMLGLYAPVSILGGEDEIDRRRGKTSRSEFSSVIFESGLLSDQEKIVIMMSVVPSGNQVSSQPRIATVKEVVVFGTTTTTTANFQGQTQEAEV
jgi:hypothetical protein